jgi:hypothetical protein
MPLLLRTPYSLLLEGITNFFSHGMIINFWMIYVVSITFNMKKDRDANPLNLFAPTQSPVRPFLCIFRARKSFPTDMLPTFRIARRKIVLPSSWFSSIRQLINYSRYRTASACSYAPNFNLYVGISRHSPHPLKRDMGYTIRLWTQYERQTKCRST